MSKWYRKREHFKYSHKNNFAPAEKHDATNLSLFQFFLRRKTATLFFFIFLIAFIICIVNAKTIAVKAKSVVVAIEIYRKYNVKISPRYVEDISKYEIKDVDVCDLKLCSWEKDDCTEWVGVCSKKNPHLRYLQGDKKPYLHRLELCTSRSTDRFDKLIKSMNENGYDPSKNIIRVWPNMQIHNGQHRSSWVAWKHGKGYKIRALVVYYPDEETREKHNMDKIGEQSIQAQRKRK